MNGNFRKRSLFLLVLICTLVFACKNTSATSTATNIEKNGVGKKVYFAAPLFNEMEKDYNLKIVSILESYGYEVFLPQRDGIEAINLNDKTEKEKIELIFNKDTEEIKKADILFAVLDGRVPDEGMCIEIGIAYASGKRCYGIRDDIRAIEIDMDLNPMIVGCFDRIFYDLDSERLINSLKDYLSKNEL